MIHEAFGIKNNLVQLGPKEQVTVSAEDDDFFRDNLYKNFGEIGETIRSLVAAYQDRVANHRGNIDSVSDIKDFIASYPEFQKLSGTVSKHVNLLGEISKYVTENDLLAVSECEQSLAGGVGDSSADEADVAGMLRQKGNLRKVDVLRLLCLFFINRQLKVTLESPEVNAACKGTFICFIYANPYIINQSLYSILTVHAIPRREIESLFRNLRDFAMLDCLTSSSKLNQLRSGQGTTELLRSSGRKIFRGLRGTENVFTQHEPVISQVLRHNDACKLLHSYFYFSFQILSGLVKHGSSPAVNMDTAQESGGGGDTRSIIAYVLGGVTYEEAKAVRDLNASLGCNIVLGGDRMWRSQDFVNSFLKE